MKAEFKQTDIEFKAYMDLFRFHQAYGIPESGVDEYWEGAMKARNELRDKYKGTSMEEVVAQTSWALMEMWHEIARGGKR